MQIATVNIASEPATKDVSHVEMQQHNLLKFNDVALAPDVYKINYNGILAVRKYVDPLIRDFSIKAMKSLIPGVAQFIETVDKSTYIVKYYDGDTMDRINVDKWDCVLSKVKKIVKELHDNDFVHMDIRPQNIIVGKNDEVTLIDVACMSELNIVYNPRAWMIHNGICDILLEVNPKLVSGMSLNDLKEHDNRCIETLSEYVKLCMTKCDKCF